MKDFYEMLGLDQKASKRDIKQAFNKKVLTEHPDKGGDVEKMKLLSEAYSTLSDDKKRGEFDKRWAAYQSSNVEKEEKIVITDFLSSSGVRSYSQDFKDEHKSLINEYSVKPLKKLSLRENLPLFKDSLPCFEMKKNDLKKWILPKEPLSIMTAAKILIDFLEGNYTSQLSEIKKYLSTQIEQVTSTTPKHPALSFFTSVHEIVLSSEQKLVERQKIIFSIKKITEYAKNTSGIELSTILPLLYNKNFRNLYFYALQLFWQSEENLFDEENLKKFDGQKEAKELLNVLRDRLSHSNTNESLIRLIHNIKLFFTLEKDLSYDKNSTQTATFFREKGFHLLDWIPAVINKMGQKCISNLYLQIGVQFQLASKLETSDVIKMADEQLALKMYLSSVALAHHSTPDVELHSNIQALKFILGFNFINELRQMVVPAIRERIVFVGNIFPLFEDCQSNMAFFKNEDKPIQLMRQLLNAMLICIEHNKKNVNKISIDHSASSVFYQLYEACIKNWYHEEYNAEFEHKIKLDLMKELLEERKWDFAEVERNLLPPYVMIERTNEGWLTANRSCPFFDESNLDVFRSIQGAEVNYKTGEIVFFLEKWNKHPIYQKAFTNFDLLQMLEKNLGGAIFSLDPVEPNQPYHPFNAMRLGPSHLYGSELLNTMLMTDYILKFLTTNQEVQGKYPFDGRNVKHMIQHLPSYLRKIIEDFHKSKPSEAVHRFWIEAGDLDVSVYDEEKEIAFTRFRLGELKMVVKKHRMERDIHGELQDVGNEDEGWPIYILTQQDLEALQAGKKIINKYAMIFCLAEKKLYYWENNDVLFSHTPGEFKESWARLCLEPKDKDGKIIQNSKNMSLIYRVTREMSNQTGQSHRYSAEFIFAHEFTIHYDEFAQYMPEFGRLKELSKITTVIRMLNDIRRNNQESIKAIDRILGESIVDVDKEIFQEFQKNYLLNHQNFISIIKDLNKEMAISVLEKKIHERLNKIQTAIQPLCFTSESPEVKNKCERWHAELTRLNPAVSSYQLWNEIINPKKDEIANELTQAKQKNIRGELNAAFSSVLTPLLGNYSYENAIESFMQGNSESLEKGLAQHEKNLVEQYGKKQFPHSSTHMILSALLEKDEKAIQSIADIESKAVFKEQKAIKTNLETGFAQINLGKYEGPVDLKGKCMWVPASVWHEIVRDEKSGLIRFSHFVYGGVNLQSKTTYLNQKIGPNGEHLKFSCNAIQLGGNQVGSGGFNRVEITRGFQSHHIISPTNKATRDHELLAAAGFDNLDARVNRIFLPKDPSSHPSRSVHDGRHSTKAMENVADKMTDIHKTGTANGWNTAQYNAALTSLISELRQDLRAGNIALNSKHRPWANT